MKIFANLKMNMTECEVKTYIMNIISKANLTKSQLTLCLPFPYLELGNMMLKGSGISLGAQNLSDEEGGSCTGEVSGAMLESVGVNYVIVGHSERRAKFKENSKIINKKIKIALKNRLSVILCVGESLADKNNLKTYETLGEQLKEALKGMYENELENIIIAYEPVWAIGTGVNATNKEIEFAVKSIRKMLSEEFSPKAGKEIVVIYGGSVTPKNLSQISKVKGIEGVLIGKSCLDYGNMIEMSNI